MNYLIVTKLKNKMVVTIASIIHPFNQVKRIIDL